MRHSLTFFTLLLAVGCAETTTPPVAGDHPVALDGKADRFDDAPELELLFEVDLEDILDHPDTSRFEASGVAVADDRVLIVFDNLRRFASLDWSLSEMQWLGDARGYGLDDDPRVRDADDFAGFEGIAVDPQTGRVSLGIEAMKTTDGEVLPVVVHYDARTSVIEWLDYEVDALNAGVEGLGYLEVDGERWLAALCETGKCDGRSRGRLILRDDHDTISTVDLPRGLDFADFSALAIDGDRLAVASQESSRVWVGRASFGPDGDLRLETEGVYPFPRQRDGDVDYCNVEGLSWVDETTLIAVSDLEKDGQKSRCRNHAEQLHLFGLP